MPQTMIRLGTVFFMYGICAALESPAVTAQAQQPARGVTPKTNFCLEYNRYAPEFKLDPKQFDIYAGLPPGEARVQRIHLTGWWRLRKLPDTMTPATWDARASRWKGGKEQRENDVGLVEGFYRPEYDDSRWPRQFVPWDWNARFPPEVKKRYRFGGVGWYRRRFTLPSSASDMRVRLHFEYVESDSTVWVDGREVGSYSTFERHPGGNRCRGNSVEAHDYDITPFVRFGEPNVLAVRVFDDGLWRYKRGSHGRDETGGIWQAVWLDLTPPVFAERVRVTPHVSEHTVTLDCHIVSKLPSAAELSLRALVKPWRSFRYSPPSSAPAAQTRRDGVIVPPGRSRLTLRLALSSPVPWDIERPFLYHAQLFGSIPGWRGGRETLIGQARFGFREFVARSDQFYLNGKRLYLAGVQINEPYRSNMLIAHNEDDWIVRWYRRYRQANVIFNRFHSGHYPEAFYDIADEVGFLICDDRLLPPVDEATTTAPGVRSAVERLIDKSYNHPSIVLYSLGNEHLSTGPGRELAQRRFRFSSSMYDLYKSFDQTRPITACSGSNCVVWFGREGGVEWPKSDYNDFHDYTGGFSGSWLDLERSVPLHRQYYRRVSGGVDKPYVNGECLAFVYQYNRHFDKLRAAMPRLDRRLYVDALTTGAGSRSGWSRFGYHFIANVGIRAYLEPARAAEARAEFHRRVVELFRRFGREQVGVNLHHLDNCFSGGRQFKPRPEYLALQKAFAPVFVCANVFDRNVVAGHALALKIYALNDSLDDLHGVRLVARLTPENATATGPAPPAFHREQGRLGQGKRAVVPCKMLLPPNARSGHYVLSLALTGEGRRTLSENSYEVYVLAPSRPIAARRRVVLHAGQTGLGQKTREILESLRVPFVELARVPALRPDDVLIIGADSVDERLSPRAAEVRRWLEAGGMAVCFEQTKARAYPFLSEARIVDAGPVRFVDLIVPEHPAFAGLRQCDLQVWNGGDRALCTSCVTPLSECVLAAAGRGPGRGFGMAVGEVRVGKGLCLFSQLLATQRYGRDAVATRFVRNLIRYAVEAVGPGALARSFRHGNRVRIRPPQPGACTALDLRPYCNMGFVDVVAGDRKGGWTDQGPRYDMRHLRPGRKSFSGVPFEVIDPAHNRGRSCLVLKGKARPYFPSRVDGIPVGRYVRRMFFLVASAWSSGSEGEEVARFVMHYEPGGVGVTREVFAPLIVGKNVGDWARLRENLPGAAVAWSGAHPQWGRPVGLYLVEWKNPFPAEQIVAMDFVSKATAVPICVAVTVEGAQK